MRKQRREKGDSRCCSSMMREGKPCTAKAQAKLVSEAWSVKHGQ